MNCLVPLSTQLAAVPRRRRSHRGRIAARRRLGQGPRRELLALASGDRYLLLLLVGAEHRRCATRRGRCAPPPTGRPTDRREPALRCRGNSRPTTCAAPPNSSGNWMPISPSAASLRRARAESAAPRPTPCTWGRTRPQRTRGRCDGAAPDPPRARKSIAEPSYHSGYDRLFRGVDATASSCRPALGRAAPASPTSRFHRQRHHAHQPAGARRGHRRRPADLRLRVRYADTSEDDDSGAPHCARAWATCCCRRRADPSAFSRTSRLAAACTVNGWAPDSETNFGINNGGGVKIIAAGRCGCAWTIACSRCEEARCVSTVHRFYAGMNLILRRVPLSAARCRFGPGVRRWSTRGTAGAAGAAGAPGPAPRSEPAPSPASRAADTGDRFSRLPPPVTEPV